VISRAIIQTDGASRGNPGPASIGGVIWDYEGQVIAEVSKAIGIATSNVAEYRALVETLAKALELGVEFVDIRLDSELIVRQVNGSYRTRKPKLKKLLSQVQGLLRSFDGYVIQHVPRWDNRHADALANKALDAR
jgi:ribonuclease HI